MVQQLTWANIPPESLLRLKSSSLSIIRQQANISTETKHVDFVIEAYLGASRYVRFDMDS